MNLGSFSVRPCVLAQVEVVEACSRHAFPRHTHDNYGIGLIASGAQRSWSGRGSVEAERGKDDFAAADRNFGGAREASVDA